MRFAPEFRKNGLRGLLAAAVLLLVPAAAGAFFNLDILFIQFATPPAAAGSGPANASTSGTNLTLIDLLFSDPGTGSPTPGGAGGGTSVTVTEFDFSGSSGGTQFNIFFELISIQFGGTPVSGFGAPQVTFQALAQLSGNPANSPGGPLPPRARRIP